MPETCFQSDRIEGGPPPRLSLTQGVLIGRIFTQWEIIYSGQFFFKITEVNQIFGYFFHSWENFDIKGLGNILGDFLYKLIWSPPIYSLRRTPVSRGRCYDFGNSFATKFGKNGKKFGNNRKIAIFTQNTASLKVIVRLVSKKKTIFFTENL
jgi:hypothetical protein